MVIKYLLKVAIYANKKNPGSLNLKSVLKWIQEEEEERKIKVDALSLDSIHMLCLLNKHTNNKLEKLINNFFDIGECVYTVADIYSLIIESWSTLMSKQDTYDALLQIVNDVPDFEDRIEQIYDLIDVIDEIIIHS